VLLDKQQAASFWSVEGVHSLVQSGTLHQPRLQILINIKHKHQIFVLKITSDR
jgi:hypothetical protein